MFNNWNFSFYFSIASYMFHFKNPSQYPMINLLIARHSHRKKMIVIGVIYFDIYPNSNESAIYEYIKN